MEFKFKPIKSEIVSIESIVPNKDNPRVIKDNDFMRLCSNIKSFPHMLMFRTIIVDEKMVVIGGNQRLKACEHLGLAEVPIQMFTQEIMDEWVKETGRPFEDFVDQFIITDNVSAGQWDFSNSDGRWDTDDMVKWGVEHPGLKVPKEKKAAEDNYKVPVKINTNIKKGDIIEIGPHRLMCGDSTDKGDIKKLLKGKDIDLIVTDPPYNVNYQGSTGMKIQNDNMANAQFYKFLLDFHTAYFDFLKEGGAVYVWHADSEGLNFRKAFEESGLMLKQCLIWVKNALVMGRQDYHWMHEPCLYGWKPGKAHYFINDRTQTTVIEDQVDLKKKSKAELLEILENIYSPETKTTILRADKPKKNDVHPTMKPILLLAPLIENSSRPGEVVADAFLWSGSTMVASHQLGRLCYGMELDPQYCQVIIERMQKLDADLKIKVNGKKYVKPKK